MRETAEEKNAALQKAIRVAMAIVPNLATDGDSGLIVKEWRGWEKDNIFPIGLHGQRTYAHCPAVVFSTDRGTRLKFNLAYRGISKKPVVAVVAFPYAQHNDPQWPRWKSESLMVLIKVTPCCDYEVLWSGSAYRDSNSGETTSECPSAFSRAVAAAIWKVGCNSIQFCGTFYGERCLHYASQVAIEKEPLLQQAIQLLQNVDLDPLTRVSLRTEDDGQYYIKIGKFRCLDEEPDENEGILRGQPPLIRQLVFWLCHGGIGECLSLMQPKTLQELLTLELALYGSAEYDPNA